MTAMCDKRFEERLKRIEARHRHGAPLDLLAGVGDVAESRAYAAGNLATVAAPRASASIMLILLGALSGFLSYDILDRLVDLRALPLMPPEDLLALLQTNQAVAAAASVLGLCALMAVASFLSGRRAVRLMSFSASALGAAIGCALPSLA